MAYNDSNRFELFAWLIGSVAWALHHKKIHITDVWRDDPDSTHFYYRAFDARIFNAYRGDVAHLTLTEHEWEWIYRVVTMLVSYDNRMDKEVILIHGSGMKKHAHCQTKYRKGRVIL